MKLVYLDIRRLPGIHAPFQLSSDEFRGDLQVIHGPNGIGKSSLVRAIKALLWPREQPGEGISLHATFLADGVRWDALREGEHVEWQRNGTRAPPPALPSPDLARNFVVAHEDFARLEDLALIEEELQKAMTGGVSFAQLANDLRKSEPRGVRADLDTAAEKRRSVQLELESLEAERQSLAELEAKLESARAQGAELPHWDRVLAVRERRLERDRLAQELGQFPQGIERLRSTDPDELERHRVGVRDLDEALRSQIEKRRKAENAARDARLAEPLGDGALEELRARVSAWKGADEALRNATRARDQQLRRSEQALEACPPGVSESALLDGAKLAASSLERFVRDAHANRVACEGVERDLALLPAPNAPIDAARHERAVILLRAWASAEGPRPGLPGAGDLVLAAVAGLCIALLAWFVHPGFLAGLALVAFLAWRRRSAPSTESMRPALQRAFAESGLTAPAWEPAAVQVRTRELEQELARALVDEETAKQRAKLDVRRRELDQEAQSLEPRRNALRGLLGFDAAASDFDLATFATAVDRYRSERVALAEAESVLDARKRELDDLMKATKAALAACGVLEVGDALDAERSIRDLESRSRALAGARRDIEDANAMILRTQPKLEAEQAELAAFWKRTGLTVDDDATLVSRCRQLPDWSVQSDKLKKLEGEIALLKRELGERVADIELTTPEVEARRRESQEADARRDELGRTIGGIRKSVEEAQRRCSLAQASAREGECRLALANALAELRRADFGAFLLEEVRREYEDDAQPDVLRRADASLLHFTKHQYGLRMSTDGRLHAVDVHRNSIAMPVQHLSSGTRAQAFLALRLSFAATAASGEAPPVFLDDALATSDAGRVAAIGEALREATRHEGRQIIYLTSEPADVQLIAGSQADSIHVVDLASLRRMQRAPLSRERAELPELAPVPHPGSFSAAEYAQIVGVDGVDPHAGVAAMHIYYVLNDDLKTLHAALERRFERVGPLRSVLEASAHWLSAEARARAFAGIAVAQSVLDSWNIGRGRPVTREALSHVDSGVSKTFLDRVDELAELVDRDGMRLLDALASRHELGRGFGASKQDGLRGYLVREGYVDPTPKLDREEAWARLQLVDLGTGGPGPAALRARFEWLWGLLERSGGAGE